MNYPYPKKAIVKYKDAFLDGGTRVYQVINFEEIGLKEIYQDFRLRISPESKGKFYGSYPNDHSQEILKDFIVIQDE